MSENLSTQFPTPPELHPLASVQAKIRQMVSLTLIISGLTLLGWGGWMFYQYQLEASKPPPRLIEVSITEPARASASQPRLTQVNAATASPKVSDAFTPANTPTPKPTLTPRAVAAQAPGSQARDTIAPSLADNPLPLVEVESPAEATAASDGATPTVSPPTRIVAESINLDAKVIEVGWRQVIQNSVSTNVWEVADYAAGWHKNSKLPGQGGNIVLSGHNNIKGEVFRYLVDLKPGDLVTLYVDEQPYDYVVADIFIVKDKGEPEAVRRENAKWIGPFNEERLTLVTCWPYTNNTHRLIVIARPTIAGQPAQSN